MKILITGANGMLGRTLRSELKDFEIIPTDLPEGDITNASLFDLLLKKHKALLPPEPLQHLLPNHDFRSQSLHCLSESESLQLQKGRSEI